MLKLGDRSADAVISHSIERLNRVIEASTAGLSSEDTEQLRGAARRSLLALGYLQARLAGQGGPAVDLAHVEPGWRVPRLLETDARSILSELDAIIAEVEHEILTPAENELTGDELIELKRSIGQVWGWIVCDLQDPLWKQYPEAAPLSR